jgi:iron complex outermembrane recepter protein
MKLSCLWLRLALPICLFPSFVIESVMAQEKSRSFYSTKAIDLLVQNPSQQESAIGFASALRAIVTGVRVNNTETGLQVILETPTGQKLTPAIASEGNNLVIDIPNATLALPERQEFIANNPATGITQIAVRPLSDTSIRVTITGEKQAATAEVIPSPQNLVLGITSSTAQAETETEQEIVVTATRKEKQTADVPRSVTTIDREEITEQSRISRDLVDIISKTTPGVNPPTGSTRSLSVRGRAAQVLIDGVPVSSNISNDGAVRELRAISPDAVERIEVVRGPSAIYGDGATGGVINIITKQAPKDKIKLTTALELNAALGGLEEDSIGNFFSQSVAVSEGKLSFLGSLSTRNDGIYYDANNNQIPFQDFSSAETDILQLSGSIGINITENQSLRFSANNNRENYDYSIISDTSVDDLPFRTFARAIDGKQEYIGADFPQTIQSTVSLNYTHRKLFGNSQLDAQAYYRDYEGDNSGFDARVFDDPLGVTAINENSERWGGRLQINTPIVDSVQVLWGADYSKENSSANTVIFDIDEFERSNGFVFRAIDERPNYPRYDLENLGLFAQAEWDISKQWLLSGGLRYEKIDVSVPDYIDESNQAIGGGDLNLDDVVFNAGLVFKATENISLFTNFSQGFSIPAISRILNTAEDGFDLDTDIELSQPQRVDSYELGIRSEWKSVQINLAGFYNESELGSTLVNPDNAPFATLVRSPQRNYGVEASLDWQVARNWQVGSTFTWQEGENDLDGDGEFEAISSFEISPMKISVYLENETLPGWNNRLQVLFVSDRNRAVEDGTEFVTVPIEGYTLVDFISSIELGKGTLSIGIENLLDEEYATISNQTESYIDSFTFPGRGRSIRVGYQFDW